MTGTISQQSNGERQTATAPVASSASPSKLHSLRSTRADQFQQRVLSYISQILYGCEEPNCTTTTCLSCQRRVKNKPFRPPTELTARALAFYLASQDDSGARLCPRKLRVRPDSLKIKPPSNESEITEATRTGDNEAARDITKRSKRQLSSLQVEIEKRKQSEKDNKSLVQNLFNTTAMLSFALCDRPIAQKRSKAKYRHARVAIEDRFSNAYSLIDEFIEKGRADTPASFLGLDPSYMDATFERAKRLDKSVVLHSLWHAVKALFSPPPELSVQKSPRLRSSSNGSVQYGVDPVTRDTPKSKEEATQIWLSDVDAARLIVICIFALCALTLDRPLTLEQTVEMFHARKKGFLMARVNPTNEGVLDHFVDEFEYEPAIRLLDRLVRGIAARRCFSEILSKLSPRGQARRHFPVMDMVVIYLAEAEESMWFLKEHGENARYMTAIIFVHWLHTLIMKNWDQKPVVYRWSAAGAAIDIIGDIYNRHDKFGTTGSRWLAHPFIADKIDPIGAPQSFLEYTSNPNTLHLLSCPWLFLPKTLVAYFRTINYARMTKQYINIHLTQTYSRKFGRVAWRGIESYIRDKYPQAFNPNLSLNVRRDHILEDTYDQLWQREKRELLKPLKVQISQDSGELGVDQGGVTQEFFRIALAEAFNPDNGMFTIDPKTRMIWLQPMSVTPLFHFELVGLLMSLAIYNGITLPVTFPLAFYKRLLGEPVTALEDIQDGWPDLAEGLKALLAWNEGDVGDVFMRTYDFSFEYLGRNIDIDMTAAKEHEQDPEMLIHLDQILSLCTGDSPLVTNANRGQYVSDYIQWLTSKSIAPQWDAFVRGFHVCLDPQSLRLFTAEAFQHLVEGSQMIDIEGLRRAAVYEEGYTSTHPTIEQFWSVVREYSEEEKRHLLEFVTATDRVPVNGASSIRFSIARNGPDSEMLPGSSTCFGRLLLPEYADREKLKRKLGVAIEHYKGFGVV